MTVFTIPDLSCDGCIGSIPRAAQKRDPGTCVRTDLATHRVDIASKRSANRLTAAIDAGYTFQAA